MWPPHPAVREHLERVLDGRLVLLCWKLGEPEVLYWHDLDAGFGGRQPLTAGSVSGGYDSIDESYND